MKCDTQRTRHGVVSSFLKREGSVKEIVGLKKPRQTISRKVPIAAPCSLHTGRTQKQRSSRIVCARTPKLVLGAKGVRA